MLVVTPLGCSDFGERGFESARPDSDLTVMGIKPTLADEHLTDTMNHSPISDECMDARQRPSPDELGSTALSSSRAL